MSNEAPRDFGVFLKEARLARGVSLREIADRTKISVHALEALERNDVQRLPGGIFTRAFVRAYAGEVGLDPERTVRLFVERFERQPDNRISGTSEVADEETGDRSQAWRRANPLALAGLAVMAIAIVAWFLLGREPAATESPESGLPHSIEPSPPAPRAESTTGGSIEPVPAAPGISPPEAGDVAAAEKRVEGLALVLTATGDCWVSATIDGSRTYQRLLRANDQVEIEADSTIVLRVGDAGAITFTLNGEPGRSLGPPGAVVSERMTIENYKDYVSPGRQAAR